MTVLRPRILFRHRGRGTDPDEILFKDPECEKPGLNNYEYSITIIQTLRDEDHMELRVSLSVVMLVLWCYNCFES